jgi:hypothetical protein
VLADCYAGRVAELSRGVRVAGRDGGRWTRGPRSAKPLVRLSPGSLAASDRKSRPEHGLAPVLAGWVATEHHMTRRVMRSSHLSRECAAKSRHVMDSAVLA